MELRKVSSTLKINVKFLKKSSFGDIPLFP